VTLIFGLSRLSCKMRTVPSWACSSFFDGILLEQRELVLITEAELACSLL
jgi:hypothetical protein